MRAHCSQWQCSAGLWIHQLSNNFESDTHKYYNYKEWILWVQNGAHITLMHFRKNINMCQLYSCSAESDSSTVHSKVNLLYHNYYTMYPVSFNRLDINKLNVSNLLNLHCFNSLGTQDKCICYALRVCKLYSIQHGTIKMSAFYMLLNITKVPLG